ncbi:hypothetical protein AB0F36_10425 [Streptomyces sp. NPDC029080]
MAPYDPTTGRVVRVISGRVVRVAADGVVQVIPGRVAGRPWAGAYG